MSQTKGVAKTTSDPKTRRNSASHRAILEATVKLIEANGYKQLTIEGIASEAGVGKQTIYRWWRSKADLVMEAYMSASDVRVPEPDTGTLEGDLLAILLPVFELNQNYQHGTALANKSLMAEAQLDADFLATYSQLHRYWWGPLRHVLERAQERGELSEDADTSALIDVMLGAAWYRMLLEHAPLDEAFARTLVKLITQGIVPKSVP
ncbi:MAG: TetR/AcrR family transcriptional regulator [Deinococcota bacterium]